MFLAVRRTCDGFTAASLGHESATGGHERHTFRPTIGDPPSAALVEHRLHENTAAINADAVHDRQQFLALRTHLQSQLHHSGQAGLVKERGDTAGQFSQHCLQFIPRGNNFDDFLLKLR